MRITFLIFVVGLTALLSATAALAHHGRAWAGIQ